VDVAVGEQLVIVGAGGGAAAGLGRGEVDVGLVDVAQGDDLGVLVGEEGVEDLVAALAQTDEAEADAVVGAQDARRRQGGEQAGPGRGLGELTAGGMTHGNVPRWRRAGREPLAPGPARQYRVGRAVSRRMPAKHGRGWSG